MRLLQFFCAWSTLFFSVHAKDVNLTVDATHDGPSIPESVYGANDVSFSGQTVNRHGGNRQTGLNWENNASNAGNDYRHSSDCYLGEKAGIGKDQTPGALLQAWVEADRRGGLRSIITLPLAGYVSADRKSEVSSDETAPGVRWEKVIVDKADAPGLLPDRTDGVVYLAEMVHFIISKYGTAAQGGVAAYSMDNEPALWPSTHPRIHPAPTSYEEITAKNIAAARMTTALDPTAEIYGPVLYGWPAYQSLQNAPDSSKYDPVYGNFASYYLAQLKLASDTAARRLLHRFDMHWYPEARGENRIACETTSPSYGTEKDIEARLQAPRSLWDPSYVENSWITRASTREEAIRLLPRLQENVNQYFPGTGLALTEYNYGGTDHISGGVAQADVLGILGRFQVAGCFWPLTRDNSYVAAAFQLYRDYNNSGGVFGKITLTAMSSDNAAAAIHAARVHANQLTVVAVNRSRIETVSVVFQFILREGQTLSGVKSYRLSEAGGAKIQPLTDSPSISAAGFSDPLPAMSATLFEVTLK